MWRCAVQMYLLEGAPMGTGHAKCPFYLFSLRNRSLFIPNLPSPIGLDLLNSHSECDRDTRVFIHVVCHTQPRSCALAMQHGHRLQVKCESKPIHMNIPFVLIARCLAQFSQGFHCAERGSQTESFHFRFPGSDWPQPQQLSWREPHLTWFRVANSVATVW